MSQESGHPCKWHVSTQTRGASPRRDVSQRPTVGLCWVPAGLLALAPSRVPAEGAGGRLARPRGPFSTCSWGETAGSGSRRSQAGAATAVQVQRSAPAAGSKRLSGVVGDVQQTLGTTAFPSRVLFPLQPRGSLAGAAFCLRARGRPGCVPGRSGFPAASTPGLLGGCRLPPPGGVHPGPGPSGPGVSFQRNLHLDRAVEAQSGWQTVWGTPQTPQPLLFPQIPILGPCGAFVTSQQPTPMRHYSPFPGSIETLLVLPSMVPSCPRPSEEGGRPAHGPFSGTRDLHGASLGTPAATSGSGGPCQVCPL